MKKISILGKKMLAAATMGFAMMAVGCAGAGGQNTAQSASDGAQHTVQAANEVVGTILLSVNPELEIQYDQNGNVVLVKGNNQDGNLVLAQYSGYDGRACKEVISELVEEIYEDGYFNQKINGKTKNIVLKLEKGSKYPSEQFLQELASEVKIVVDAWGLGNAPMTIGNDDYMENGYISADKAKEIVLAQLGLPSAEFVQTEYELDDGVYELEFRDNGVEYEFEVNATTGKIQEADRENNDDWALIDTDYGPNNDGVTDYNDTDYGPNNDGVTDYDDTDYGPNNDGVTDYNDTDYGPNNDGVTDYNDTDYGPNNDGVTDYNDTDYGPNNDGVTDYDDTDYGPNNDGVTDYNDTDYGPNNDGVTDYNSNAGNTSSGNTGSSSGNSDYGNSNYGNSNYGNSNYGSSDYDD